MMHACTIVARNYLAQASALADSWVATQAEGTFTILCIDLGHETVESDDPRIRVVGPAGAGFAQDEFDRMATLYGVVELATAVKPGLMRHLLRESGEAVCYLDPDILVFRPLGEIERHARRDDIVLTPHTYVPLPDDGRRPHEAALLECGVFNLGFIAVGPGGGPFLDWWADRLSRQCLDWPEVGLFVDQKWIDLVPCYFRHRVLRDPAVNVAYWNLPVRELTRDAPDDWRVDGRPLVFFHFSGYDPAAPHRLSRYQGDDPRVRLDEHPDLRALCDLYAGRLAERGHAELRRAPYRLARTASGMEIEPRMRRVYRRALRAAESAGGALPPTPFDREGDRDFAAWLASPVDGGPLTLYGLTAWMDEPSVRERFPELPGPDAARLAGWLVGGGAESLGMAPGLCRAGTAVPVG